MANQLDDLKKWIKEDIFPFRPTPILHNEDCVILQFHGWSLNLYKDGTWIIEATDGG